MSLLATARSYRPRRPSISSPPLPPGQREVSAFPRFSDDPLRWAPEVGDPVVEVSIPGQEVHVLDLRSAGSSFIERTHDFHCVTTWSYRGVRWGGYVLADLFASGLGLDVASLPKFAAAYGADDRHAVFCTEDLVHPSVLLATELDGQPIGQRHGGAVRLVCPLQYGYKSAKHLRRIEFSDERPTGSFGKKEHLRGRVSEEERHGTLPNWLLRRPYRLTVVPTALVADRGLANSPSMNESA